MLPQGIILNEQDLQLAVNYFLTQEEFAFDIESAYDHRLDPNRNTVTWISLATYGCTIVIPLGHMTGELIGTDTVVKQYGGTGPRAGKFYNKTVNVFDTPPVQLDAKTVFKILAPLFSNPNIRKIGHDVLFDALSIAKYLGFIPVPPYGCTKIGFWLLDENRFTRGLKEMTELFYDFKYDFENIGACVESHPFLKVAYYSFCDSKFDFLHWTYIKDQLKQQNLESIFKLEMDVLNVLIGMRIEGVRVDVEKIESLREELAAKLPAMEADIYKAAGKKFNLNSNHQKQDILFGSKESGGQGLKPWKLTDGGKDAKKAGKELTIRHYSTDDAVLESLQGNPVVDALREYGDVSKIVSTYLGAWLGSGDKDAHIVDGRIHARFLQFGTVTGRFSSSTPNLQNIPRPAKELGRQLRSVFIADPGRKLICADYSQIELVVLAHYIEQGALYDGFLKGIDPHTLTAAMILDKDPEDVTKNERQDFGKTPNFAIIYGAGLNKTAALAHTDLAGAKRILKKHEQMFPEIHEFKWDIIEGARARRPVPYITTLLGRKRRTPDLISRDETRRRGAELKIFNSLIQGGAADIMKKAMIRVDAMLPEECKIHLCVHDELLISAPEHLVDEATKVMYEGMTGKGISKYLNVPLKIDLHVGNSWLESK